MILKYIVKTLRATKVYSNCKFEQFLKTDSNNKFVIL